MFLRPRSGFCWVNGREATHPSLGLHDNHCVGAEKTCAGCPCRGSYPSQDDGPHTTGMCPRNRASSPLDGVAPSALLTVRAVPPATPSARQEGKSTEPPHGSSRRLKRTLAHRTHRYPPSLNKVREVPHAPWPCCPRPPHLLCETVSFGGRTRTLLCAQEGTKGQGACGTALLVCGHPESLVPLWFCCRLCADVTARNPSGCSKLQSQPGFQAKQVTQGEQSSNDSW